MELIGEAMGLHIPDLYKRLSLMGDIDTIVADTADLIAANGLDIEVVRDIVAKDMLSGARLATPLVAVPNGPHP